MKCFYALVKLWEQTNQPWDKSVTFSLHELSRILRMSWSGRTFQLIEEWLDHLKKIPIDWINSYYQKDTDTVESILHSFTILSDLVIYKKKEGSQIAFGLSSFKFHERILRNLLEHNTKPLNLAVLLKLEKEISILLYRHLDLVMADKTRYERRTASLIAEDLQLEGERYAYPSRRRQVLEPALAELKGVELSTGILTEARLERTADGSDWKAVFEKIPFEHLPEAGTSSVTPEGRIESLVQHMIEALGDEHSRGFYLKVARACPHEVIYRLLSEVKDDWLQGRVRKSKGAHFTGKIKRYCQEKGIDLGLKSE
ncbi:MAG: RepB family plasmid replication initiator protein [Candidatus Bipolaricaulia bacterium]